MKVAVCISGYLRTFERTFPNFKKYILDNSNISVDTFIHTWGSNERNSSTTFLSRCIDLYQPQNIVIEPVRSFQASPMMVKKNIDKRNISGVLGMFYKIFACNQLKIEHEKITGTKYDIVIRLRPDIDIRSEIPFILHDGISVPKHGDYRGINDQFALGSSEAMDNYSSVFLNFEKHLQKILELNPELILKEHLGSFNFQIKRPYIKYAILRENGSEMDNQIMERVWGFVK